MSKFVTDQVYWNNEKILRKRVSAADVAFSVFGNDDTTPLLAKRIRTPTAESKLQLALYCFIILTHIRKAKFRDGHMYQGNLAAARESISELPDSAWKSSLYTVTSPSYLALLLVLISYPF